MIRSFKVGDRFPDLLHHDPWLPVGAQVALNNSLVYQRIAPGVWQEDRGEFLGSYMVQQAYWLRHLPDGQEQVELPGESMDSFRWRIRDSALASAERSGVGIRPVEDLCRDLGAETPRLTLGGRVSSNHDAVQLPQGTLLTIGDPSCPKRFGVLQVRERRLERVFGNTDHHAGGPMTIYSCPVELPVIGQEREATTEELASIALRAWRLGRIVKRRVSWCSAFEATMTALGIDDAAIAPTGETVRIVGDEVNRQQAAALPEGTLLYHRWRSYTRSALWRRDDSYRRSASRTRLLWASREGTGPSHDTMTIAWLPGDPMRLIVHGSELRAMPDGVTFQVNTVTEGQPQTLNHQTRAELQHWIGYVLTDWPGVTS
jgi:hypothetical protein